MIGGAPRGRARPRGRVRRGDGGRGARRARRGRRRAPRARARHDARRRARAAAEGVPSRDREMRCDVAQKNWVSLFTSLHNDDESPPSHGAAAEAARLPAAAGLRGRRGLGARAHAPHHAVTSSLAARRLPSSTRRDRYLGRMRREVPKRRVISTVSAPHRAATSSRCATAVVGSLWPLLGSGDQARDPGCDARHLDCRYFSRCATDVVDLL